MHERTGEFLQTPLVERLAEGVAALEDAAETARDPSSEPQERRRPRFSESRRTSPARSAGWGITKCRK